MDNVFTKIDFKAMASDLCESLEETKIQLTATHQNHRITKDDIINQLTTKLMLKLIFSIILMFQQKSTAMIKDKTLQYAIMTKSLK